MVFDEFLCLERSQHRRVMLGGKSSCLSAERVVKESLVPLSVIGTNINPILKGNRTYMQEMHAID